MKPATVLSSSDSLVAPVGVSRSRAAPRRAAVAARASADAAATGPAVGVGNTFRTATDRVTLGTSDLSVAATGAGAWAWGDRSGYWGSDWEGDRAKNLDAYRTLLAGGVDFIDTAEVYGFGKSEELIREFMRDTAADATLCPPLLATKFAPIPFRFRAEDVPNALRASMARMGVRKVALYMQHWPAFGLPGVTEACNDAFLEGLCLCYEQGLCRAVGVSNFNAERVRRAAKKFEERGVPFASNQIQYSLAYRTPETDTGVMDACKECGVTPVAYSPMAQGLLTGKYSAASPLGEGVKATGPRARILSDEKLASADALVDLMREIGTNRGGVTPAQVAVNYCMTKGTVPIPGAKDARQAEAVVGCLGWRLDEAEVAELEAAAASLPSTPGAPFEKW